MLSLVFPKSFVATFCIFAPSLSSSLGYRCSPWRNHKK